MPELWIIGGISALLAMYLLLRKRDEGPPAPPAHTPPRRVMQQPVTPEPTKTLEQIARDLIAAISPAEAAALADAADETLDNGDPSLNLKITGPDGQQSDITLRPDFLEVLLDEMVERYPHLQDMIDAPRERRSRRLPDVLVRGLSHPIEIAYEDAQGNESQRKVTLRRILGEAPASPTHIGGVCHERKALRNFRLDRVIELIDHTTGEVLDDTSAIVGWAAAIVAAPPGSRREPHQDEPAATPEDPVPPHDFEDLVVLRDGLSRPVEVVFAGSPTPATLHIHAVLGGKRGRPRRLYGRWSDWGYKPRALYLGGIRSLNDPASGMTLTDRDEIEAWARRLVEEGRAHD